MNAILNALKDIHITIPEEILNLAFMDNGYMVNKAISIDECIMNKFIRPKILIDCNLVGGVEMNVSFNGMDMKQVSTTENSYILEIPKQATNGASIITANNILMSTAMFANGNYLNVAQTWYNGFNNISFSPVLSSGIRAMNALSDLNIVQTSRLEVVGENIILIVDPMYIGGNGILKCFVENPKNLENLNPRSYMSFADLVVIGCKAYIFNKLRVPLDRGYVTGGHELSVIKDIVEGYSDAYSMYLEEIQKWKKVAFLNNNISKASFIKNLMPFVG